MHLKLRQCYTSIISPIKEIKASVLPAQKGFPGDSPGEAETAPVRRSQCVKEPRAAWRGDHFAEDTLSWNPGSKVQLPCVFTAASSHGQGARTMMVGVNEALS